MDEQTRYSVTDVVDGDSLEAALRDYGPAAIEDLLPRLRAIAVTLDQAHAAGQVHGALHPQNIFITAETTRVSGIGESNDAPGQLPYSAPEIVAGEKAQPASDQFALAAIAFEWMFGRRIFGPAARPLEVRTLPGVDRDAMSKAFTRALSPEPGERFASCTAFSDALAATVIPVLPLGGASAGGEDVLGSALHERDVPSEEPVLAAGEQALLDEALVEAFVEELFVAEAPPFVEEPALVAKEPALVTEEPAFAAKAAPAPLPLEPRLSPPERPVASWQPSASYVPAKSPERFGGGMLVIACLVGMVFGFAAGYMARPRALQSGMAAGAAGESGAAGAAGAVGAAGPTGATGPVTPGTEAAVSPAPSAAQPSPASRAPADSAAKPPVAAAPPAAAGNVGRLLVRSTPSGASVEVDGVARGETPLALRDLALGSRTVTVARRGFISEEQRVVLTRSEERRVGKECRSRWSPYH